MSKLNFLNGWTGISEYFTRRSAQSYFSSKQMMLATSGCGSACGSEDGKPKPAACGAADDGGKPQPSACGAGDDIQPKPSACGSSCGSDDK